MSDTRHPDTLAVHAGRSIDPHTGAVTPALQPSTTFERDPDGGYARGYDYGRSANPNRGALEQCLAALEGGGEAAAFASGTAATLAVFYAVGRGGHIIASHDAYHGTTRQLRELVGDLGTQVSFVDTARVDAVAAAWRDDTRLLWVETPSNPLLRLSDVEALARFARERGGAIAVDNTFATPVLQNPLDLGADFVVHSSTKYIGGHSDVTGGAVIAAGHAGFADVRRFQQTAGAVPSPFDCWLLLRSAATLPVRVRAQSASAARVAGFLAGDPRVESVSYPGLAQHPDHALAARQMAGGGGMISFCVQAPPGEEAPRAMAVAARTGLFTRATSLGGVESLIEHRASIEGPGSLSPPGLLRLSIGLEHVDDLLADLDRALGG